MKFEYFISSIIYLKPIQIFWRIKIWVFQNFFKMKNPYEKYEVKKIILSNYDQISDENINTFKIFNDKLKVQNIIWQSEDKPRLWLYHLHYFDFLKNISKEDGVKIIYDWIDENSPGSDIAWDPYPISIRVVNWIKFLIRFNIDSPKIFTSLITQGFYLFNQREYHLLANHLFKNIVALLYLGILFENKKWVNWSIKELKIQLREQITEAGYHYEFSPTYHEIFVKDLLDLYDILQKNYPIKYKNLISTIADKIKNGMDWLEYFYVNKKYLPINDVNYEGLPEPDKMIKYAEKLGIKYSKRERNSTYYPIMKNKNLKIMMYCAPFNPSYNPSHSHSDLLSVLLWSKRGNILTDTGNHSYSDNAFRKYARSAAAHSTVVIDGLNQADLWGSFRIGKRAKIEKKVIGEDEIICSYRYKKRFHERRIMRTSSGFNLQDSIEYMGKHKYELYFHFEPENDFRSEKNKLIVNEKICFFLPNKELIIKNTSCFPKMYQTVQKITVIVKGEFHNRVRLKTRINIL